MHMHDYNYSNSGRLANLNNHVHILITVLLVICYVLSTVILYPTYDADQIKVPPGQYCDIIYIALWYS